MRRLRENAMLEAEITTSGDVLVEDQHVGHLSGFRFAPDPQADGEAAKALNAAAQKALASEIEGRARRVHEAVDEAFVLANDGIIRWLGEPIGKIAAGEQLLEPRVNILADEQLTGPLLEMVQQRLDLWLAQHVKKLLGPLIELEKGEGLEGIARGIAFRIAESLGVLERTQVAEDVKNLPQEARAALRKLGVRFGAYHLYVPSLIRPAPRALAAQLWALQNGGVEGNSQVEVPHLAASGRTSFIADKDVPKGFYRAAGFHVCGERAVRVDILERLADLIRPAVAYRPGITPGEPPPGAADGDGFVVTVAMTSLAGCSGESFASILRALGYVSDQRKGPAITLAQAANAPVEVATDNAAQTPSSAEPVAEAEPGAESVAAQGSETAAQIEAGTEIEPAVASPTPEETPPAPSLAASEAPTAEAASADEAVAPILIEVWRPRRQPRRDQRAKRRMPRRDEAHAFKAREAGVAKAEPIGTQNTPRPERKYAGRPRPAEEGGNARPAPQPQARPQRSGPRKDKGREAQLGEAQRHAGEMHRHGVWASTEKSRERQPDPNSPFAKLLVLKQQMESRGKN